jgi:tight adherence protein C
VNTMLLLSSISFVIGGLLLVAHVLAGRREPFAVRLARVEGRISETAVRGAALQSPGWLVGLRQGWERDLRRAGGEKALPRFLLDKALLGFAAPFVVLAPYAAATGRLPSLALVVLLAIVSSFVPDLLLRQRVKERREAIFLDLPEAISVLSLSLGAGQSLRQALELAGRDCAGPLGAELERALTLARKERGLSEREALVRVAREAGEPTFTRFCELLAVKESPYLDFLRQQAREARGEQARYLERAADRAYLAMHAPLAPLLAVLVLVLAYGFLRFLAHTV